ncbi:MAG: GDSL family lipase [Nitrospirae bacterium]|nr:GDSL family lipase [Nitrospirota bacterium]
MNILFIGHSLIEFFDWQKRFPCHKVFNLGVAGETVEGLLSRLDQIIKDHPSADVIYLMTGLNNIAMEDIEFIDSYKKIIARLSSAFPKAQVYINSILPTLLEFIPDKSIQEVNRSLKGLAADSGVQFLNIYKYFLDEEGNPVKDYFLHDGVHLSDKGYAVWSGVLDSENYQLNQGINPY